MKDYLSDFLINGEKNTGALKRGNPQNPQKPPLPVSAPPFEGFEGSPSKALPSFSGNPTPEKIRDRPRLGSFVRPVICRGDQKIRNCPWETCAGEVEATGRNRYFCESCKTWFELQPLDLSVFVDDLAEDITGTIETEWVM